MKRSHWVVVVLCVAVVLALTVSVGWWGWHHKEYDKQILAGGFVYSGLLSLVMMAVTVRRALRHAKRNG